ncbi:MAG: hypothetical protein AB8B63_17485 [Granulosicoccus sp.]
MALFPCPLASCVPYASVKDMATRVSKTGTWAGVTLLTLTQVFGIASAAYSAETITVADAPLTLAYYSDGSCLLTVDNVIQAGKTVIDADVDDVGSRMLLHCDTNDGRRLTMLARGDSLNVAQRVDLLSREEISNGEFGMIAWLTRSGVHYTDDSAPRRFVIAGSVKLSKSPSAEATGVSLHSQGQAFATVTGLLEPILKTNEENDSTPLPEPDAETVENQTTTLLPERTVPR